MAYGKSAISTEPLADLVRAGLPAKVLRYTRVIFHALVNHPCGQTRMIGPSVYVRPHPAKVDVRVAAFGHAQEDIMHRSERLSDGRQLLRDNFRLMINDRMLRRDDSGERPPSFGFDGDVNHNKPLFVLTAEKILQQHNVAELDRALGI